MGTWMGGARGTGQLQTELLTFTPDFAGLDKKLSGSHVRVNLHEAVTRAPKLVPNTLLTRAHCGRRVVC